MKVGKCETSDCTADVTNKCHLGNDSPEVCPKWKALNLKVVNEKRTPVQKLAVSWTGEDFKINDIENISRRSNPFIIGIVGHEDSAKTSFLGALFTLLVNGNELKKYKFSGSQTLLRWEYLMSKLRFDKGTVKFPAPTPSGGEYYSFLHLMLKNSDQRLKDILFADLSGEVFSQWTVDVNAITVENVRWLMNFANGFIFFINAKTIAENRMAAVNDILDMAYRLKNHLEDRPVIAVWSKADEIINVNTNHVEKVETVLKKLFNQNNIYQISNYLDLNSNPDPKSLNNLHLLEDLLDKMFSIKLQDLSLNSCLDVKDFFLKYRGHES